MHTKFKHSLAKRLTMFNASFAITNLSIQLRRLGGPALFMRLFRQMAWRCVCVCVCERASVRSQEVFLCLCVSGGGWLTTWAACITGICVSNAPPPPHPPPRDEPTSLSWHGEPAGQLVKWLAFRSSVYTYFIETLIRRHRWRGGPVVVCAANCIASWPFSVLYISRNYISLRVFCCVFTAHYCVPVLAASLQSAPSREASHAFNAAAQATVLCIDGIFCCFHL